MCSSASGPVAEGDYLGELKMKRAEAKELERVAGRLHELHATPSTEPASTELELQQLGELLGVVHAGAERVLDSRPDIE